MLGSQHPQGPQEARAAPPCSRSPSDLLEQASRPVIPRSGGTSSSALQPPSAEERHLFPALRISIPQLPAARCCVQAPGRSYDLSDPHFVPLVLRWREGRAGKGMLPPTQKLYIYIYLKTCQLFKANDTWHEPLPWLRVLAGEQLIFHSTRGFAYPPSSPPHQSGSFLVVSLLLLTGILPYPSTSNLYAKGETGIRSQKQHG